MMLAAAVASSWCVASLGLTEIGRHDGINEDEDDGTNDDDDEFEDLFSFPNFAGRNNDDDDDDD